MKRRIHFKTNFIHFFIFLSFFIFFILILINCCAISNEVITITPQDIINSKPTPPIVKLDKKELRTIETMEKRHFPRTYPEFSDAERLKNLEYKLLGKIWEFSPKEDRIKKLKLASSNVALSGVSLPAKISSRRNAKRMSNNQIDYKKPDSVGLIDGFLRLKNPELYEKYRKRADEIYFKYER